MSNQSQPEIDDPRDQPQEQHGRPEPSDAESDAWERWQIALAALDAAHERARRMQAAYLVACDRSARAPSLTKASPEPSAEDDDEPGLDWAAYSLLRG